MTVDVTRTLPRRNTASAARWTSDPEPTMSRKLMEMPTNTRPSSAADAPTCASAKLSQSPILYANAGLLGVRSYPRRALRRSPGRHQVRMLGWGMADTPDLLSRRQAMGLLAGLDRKSVV